MKDLSDIVRTNEQAAAHEKKLLIEKIIQLESILGIAPAPINENASWEALRKREHNLRAQLTLDTSTRQEWEKPTTGAQWSTRTKKYWR